MAATPRIPTNEISVLKKDENPIKKNCTPDILRRKVFYREMLLLDAI